MRMHSAVFALLGGLCAQTFRRKVYATASGLKSWRNWRFEKAGLLTTALAAGHRAVRCKALRPRLGPGGCQLRWQVDRRAEVLPRSPFGAQLGADDTTDAPVNTADASENVPEDGAKNESDNGSLDVAVDI